jgi:hypothetical protein
LLAKKTKEINCLKKVNLKQKLKSRLFKVYLKQTKKAGFFLVIHPKGF